MSERLRPPSWPVWLAAGLVLAGLVGVLVVWGSPLYEMLADQRRIQAWIQTWGAAGPLAIALLEIAQVLLAPIPGQAIDAVSGYLFGIWLGTLYAALGIAAGSLLNFALARRFGRPVLARLLKPGTLRRLDDLARRGGALFFFLIWLLPLVPDDLACLASGLTPMPVSQFLILMIIGRVPGILVSTWLGANATKLSPVWWGILLATMAVGAVIVWRWGERIQGFLLSVIERTTSRPR
jgi:uncharacterized membrane protein YdjX (TVP38/TMEM64 family)